MRPIGDEAEEARQMELAIAASLAEEERRRADVKHDESTVLYAIVDSLRDASGSSASGAAAVPASAARGREMARSILEAHIASGAGL